MNFGENGIFHFHLVKDYLYISLGGNRKGKLLTYRNLILTMLLGGLWHGSSWNFIIWGLIHGFILALEKILFSKKKKNIALNMVSFIHFQQY